MTPLQIKLARHALGLPNDSKASYRNRFVIGPGGDNHAAWTSLVRDGDAESDREGRMDWFWLTRQGAEKVLHPGERLDPEDFPEATPCP